MKTNFSILKSVLPQHKHNVECSRTLNLALAYFSILEIKNQAYKNNYLSTYIY